MKTLGYTMNLKLIILASLIFNFIHAQSMNFVNIDTSEINQLKKEIPTTFIPGIINKEFLEAVYLKANQLNSESKGDIIYAIAGKIDKNYLKDKKQVAIKTVSQEIYKGKLICVSKHGVYIYNENDLGLVFCDYKSIDWIRRGRSYGNWLWKAAIGLGTFFAYEFKEQSTSAYMQAYLAGAAGTVTLGQIVVAPIYSLRLHYSTIKFVFNGSIEKGIDYYTMVIQDQKNYSNAVNFNSFPGYMPSEN
jgi:hypothetical protein